MSDLKITPTNFQDTLEFMSTQKLAMESIEAKIDQLDGDPGSNAIRDEIYRNSLIANYEWHGGEFKRGLAIFSELAEELCDNKKFLNAKKEAA